MAMAYNYSSTAGAYTLVGAISASATSLALDSVTGLPAQPFKLVIDPGTGSEEIVKVTGIAGTTLTVVRGWDSTSAVTHASLASVRHMMTAEDLRLSRQHEDSSVDVHGIVGALVGTTNSQSLSNKDLSSATNAFPATLVTTTGTQNLSNKTINAPIVTGQATAERLQITNNIGVTFVPLIVQGMVGQTASLQLWRNSAGTTLANVDKDGNLSAPNIVTKTGAETLTNKTFTTPNTTTPSLTVQGINSQTANYLEVKDYAGAVVARAGSLLFEAGGVAIIYPSTMGFYAGADRIVQTVTIPSADVRGNVIKAAALQTANLTEWRNNAGAVLSNVKPDGTLSAPAVEIGGVSIPKFKVLQLSGTTDATGYITTTHGLGWTPSAVLAYNSAPGTTFAVYWGADSIGATTFRTRWHHGRDGFDGTHVGYLAGATVNFTAVCFA